jgi:hypothetical protein
MRRRLVSESEQQRRAVQRAQSLAANAAKIAARSSAPATDINPTFLYTRQETALILSVSVPTVRRMEDTGRLPNPVRPSGSPNGKACHVGRDIIAVRDGQAG